MKILERLLYYLKDLPHLNGLLIDFYLFLLRREREFYMRIQRIWEEKILAKKRTCLEERKVTIKFWREIKIYKIINFFPFLDIIFFWRKFFHSFFWKIFSVKVLWDFLFYFGKKRFGIFSQDFSINLQIIFLKKMFYMFYNQW